MIAKPTVTSILSGAVFSVCLASPVWAASTWDSLKPEIVGSRAVKDATGIINLKAPYRPDNNMSVPLVADIKLPAGETLKTVSFVVDENPSPVAAKFEMAGSRNAASLTTNIRLNQQSDVHIVVETGKGDVYIAEQLVKFAGGQASCSAPPTGDPAEIKANMGKMNFALLGDKAAASKKLQRAKIDLNHPNHTGMVLDQITLLYVQLLMVDKIEVRQGDDLIYTMTGSITLAQNPAVEFDFVTNGATELNVEATDTSGAKWQHKFPLGPAS
jgi:sulfur-oxidizing protein SoxY